MIKRSNLAKWVSWLTLAAAIGFAWWWYSYQLAALFALYSISIESGILSNEYHKRGL